MDLAELAAEADLAAGHQVVGDGRPCAADTSASASAEVGARLDDLHAAGHHRVDVGLAADAHPRGCSSTASTSASRPLSSPWADRRGVREGRLGTTRACTSTSSGRCPSRTGATTEPAMPGRRSARNSADGSGTPARPALGHLEQAELVGGAEAVLHGPQQAQGVVALALEGEHRVDEVLEHPRARPGRRPW